MTEYIVTHVENGAYHVLDTWSSPAAAREHLAMLIDVAWGEGAIVTIPCVGGTLATDRAHVEVVDAGALGEYDLRIVPVTFVEVRA